MPRFKRIVSPGSVLHIVVRFVNRERLIPSAVEREEYLRRAGLAFGPTDWRVISYAVMSTHVHLGAIAGVTPFECIARPHHAGFAGWINRRLGRLGPVVANRPATFEISGRRAARMIAYQHNNPVRAGLVKTASASDWTSHGAYLGVAPCPSWLSVDLGLALCGILGDLDGPKAFDELVASFAACPSDFRLSPEALAEDRREIRHLYGSAVDVAYPILDDSSDGRTYQTLALNGESSRTRWAGDLSDVLEATSRVSGIGVDDLRGGSRRRDVASARRVAVVVSRAFLGRTLTEIARRLNITPEAARQLELGADPRCHETAERVAAVVVPGGRT